MTEQHVMSHCLISDMHMHSKTRGLRETWPDVQASCKLHFEYLR